MDDEGRERGRNLVRDTDTEDIGIFRTTWRPFMIAVRFMLQKGAPKNPQNSNS